MSRLRTIIHFQDYIDGEFSWRIREIDQLRKLVRSQSNLGQQALIRAGIPILYAHWEGFVKRGAEAFLNFVSNQGKKYSDLKICFSIHGVSDKIELLTESKKTRQAD